ncbi:MAG: carboxymuconolactone decarboxylase family protein [Chloroflexi bacterium]|nr:carboxymuconolactone decarboxylase family protein [Chloroflexota bacterium]
MSQRIMDAFQEERAALNDLVMRYAQRDIKRFYNLDTQVYREGALPTKTKELLGLVASLVLRCDDCVRYHVGRCHDEGVSNAEFEEAMAIGLVVGGSIVIPHQRRAFQAWDELQHPQG